MLTRAPRANMEKEWRKHKSWLTRNVQWHKQLIGSLQGHQCDPTWMWRGKRWSQGELEHVLAIVYGGEKIPWPKATYGRKFIWAQSSKGRGHKAGKTWQPRGSHGTSSRNRRSKDKAELELEVGQGSTFSKPTPSDFLPPAGSHLQKVP